MGKFQLNKKGEDPIKIYEDAFKIAEGTVETHLDKLGKQPKPIAREAHDIFGDPDNQDSDFQWHKADSSDLLKTNQPVRNPDGSIYSIPFDYQWNQKYDLQDQVGRADYRSNYPSSESDDTSRFEADIENDQLIQKLPTDKRSFNVEADNFPQKDFGSVNQWEDDLDELRGLGGKLPDTNALWNSVEAIASEDYGNMNLIQNPDSDSDGYPMDQEGYARASWDDASIEDRKNWLFVAGYDSERGDEYEPYFSLDSHIRAQLAKDLQIGGIYAMGTGSL